jgi:queuine tRNA-ribosyltransferase
MDFRGHPLPLFFPDATRAVDKTLDSEDIKATQTPGVLVNTYHLIKHPGLALIKKAGGIRGFMNWQDLTISDSGGFQILSLPNKITDKGVTFKAENEPSEMLTPEKSIEFQLALNTDLCVVLDHFTPPNASREEAEETVRRTLLWAERSKKEFDRLKGKAYLIGVVQGGSFQDLRETCAKALVKMGFDGLGYGGWPIDSEGNFDYATAETIARVAPKGYFLYGLGIGKPHEIVALTKMGYNLFDCVLPTRDARHKRLYVFKARSIKEINLKEEKFYSYFTPNKEKYYRDLTPVSTACDCLLCTKYSRAYLAHLFRINEISAMRLASIHNLRFYSLLMEKLR